MKRIIACLICIFLIPSIGIAELTVYFLDVGQGDSAIVVCDNQAMVIDGGLPGQSDKLFSFITNNLQSVRFLYIVATHPDNDHIGGLPAVLEAVNKIQKKANCIIYSPVKEHDSLRFADLKNKAEQYDLKIKVPHSGDKLDLGKAKVVFYNCDERKSIAHSATDWIKNIFSRDDPEENEENNNMSLVVKIIYEDVAFLFPGDIETEAEKDLISPSIDLGADVLKVAHHGSNSSSSIDFLAKVKPKYAIISCGKGNRYGHPNQETLNELRRQNVELYRTDLQGTIICHSDGHSITFEKEKTTESNVFLAPIK